MVENRGLQLIQVLHYYLLIFMKVKYLFEYTNLLHSFTENLNSIDRNLFTVGLQTNSVCNIELQWLYLLVVFVV